MPLRTTSILLAATLLAACTAEAPPAPAPRSVLVETVGHAAPGGAIYTGEIRARYETDLAFRVGGKLLARTVDVGMPVKAGQVLARLDPADLQLAEDSARAQLAAASSDFATARAERERYRDLLAKKFVSQAAFDAKDNAFNATRGRLEQARAQAALSRNQSSYGTLSSASPGIVTAVLAEAGQVVSAGQAVFRVARPEEKEVAIAVPESRLAELRAPRDIRIGLWADPAASFRGALRELAPAADPATRTYAARIRILDPAPELRLGMTARVALGGLPAETLRVPLGAVMDRGQGPFVWVVANGRTSYRPVRVERFVEDGAIIADGLKNGEQVVVAGAGKLVADQAVSPKTATPPERQR